MLLQNSYILVELLYTKLNITLYDMANLLSLVYKRLAS